jgi:hypothetical protein
LTTRLYTKVNGVNRDSDRVKVFKFGRTVLNTLDTGTTIRLVNMDVLYTQMEDFTKEHGVKMKPTVSACTRISMAVSTKAIGCTICSMERESKPGLTNLPTMANSRMERKMVRASLVSLMAAHSMGFM